MRRKGAEDAAKRIKEEDEKEAAKEKASLAEKEKRAKLNQDFIITTSKLEEKVEDKPTPKEERVIVKKTEVEQPKKIESIKTAPALSNIPQEQDKKNHEKVDPK